MSDKLNLNYFKSDLISGISVAALSLPVGIAYAELLGLPAESGIYTAIFALVVYFFIGSTKELIIGPDSATVALLASTVIVLSGKNSELNIQYIAIISVFTGILFFIAGYFKLGFIANFLSKPILVGFLNGIAGILIISQLQKFTGVSVEQSHSIDGLFEFISNLTTIHFPTLITGVIALILIKILKLISGKLPAQFIIIVIAVICTVLFNLGKFGITLNQEISSAIPKIIIPDFSLIKGNFAHILFSSMALLFLSYTNQILTARSFAKDKHAIKPNQEFYATGLADIVCGFFRGYPVSGAESRTAINIKTGSQSKLSGLLAAGIMIFIVFFFSKEFSFIPSAVFAAIIIDAAIGIFNFKEMKEIFSFSKEEFFISILCMAGVLMIGVLNGILLSVIMSILLLVRKSSSPEDYEMVYDDEMKFPVKLNNENKNLIKEGILIFRFNSAILFYNSNYFRDKLLKMADDKENLKFIIVDAGPVNFIDISARNELVDIIKEFNGKNIKVLFVDANEYFKDKLSSQLQEESLNSEIFLPTFELTVESVSNLM